MIILTILDTWLNFRKKKNVYFDLPLDRDSNRSLSSRYMIPLLYQKFPSHYNLFSMEENMTGQ